MVTLRALWRSSRAQAAQQIAALVVPRDRVLQASVINRVAPIKTRPTGVGEIERASRGDKWEAFRGRRFARAIGAELRAQLGTDTVVASRRTSSRACGSAS